MDDDFEDWFVPGALVVDGAREIRLRPPQAWHRVVLDIPRAPPSMNTDQLRAWRSYAKLKRDWQTEIELLLMVERVKRGGYQRAIAGAFLRFRDRRRRDPPNFAGLVTKSLADALVAYGAIEDDDDRHYIFGGVEIEEETGAPRTTVFIYLQPGEG